MLKRILILLTIVSLLAAALPAYAMAPTLSLGDFDAENLNAETEETITPKAFEAAEITLVNFWATWCGPCIRELPYLAQISEITNGRVQVIGVQLDAVTELGVRNENAIEAMNLLVADAGVEYPVLLPDETLMTLGNMFQAVPTTIIVDSKGAMQEMVVGSKTLDQWLDFAEKAGVKAYGKDFTLDLD